MEDVLTERVPGAAFGFSQPIELRVSELISGARSDVAIQIYGEDLDVLRRLGDEVARAVSQVPGADDVKVEQVAGLPILTVSVDRRAIARHGVNADDVLAGVEDSNLNVGGKAIEDKRNGICRARHRFD